MEQTHIALKAKYDYPLVFSPVMVLTGAGMTKKSNACTASWRLEEVLPVLPVLLDHLNTLAPPSKLLLQLVTVREIFSVVLWLEVRTAQDLPLPHHSNKTSRVLHNMRCHNPLPASKDHHLLPSLGSVLGILDPRPMDMPDSLPSPRRLQARKTSVSTVVLADRPRRNLTSPSRTRTPGLLHRLDTLLLTTAPPSIPMLGTH